MHLRRSWRDSAAEVGHRLGAVQAQDYGPAKWSVGERVNGVGGDGVGGDGVGGDGGGDGDAGGVTDRSLDRAFADGSILRTHLLRPTWHFVAPADIRWRLALTAPRVHALNAYSYRQLELDEAVRGPGLPKLTRSAR